MNRRGFLSSLIAVPAAAWIAPNVLATNAPIPPIGADFQQIYFKNIPLVFSEYAPSIQIYFLSRNGAYVLRDGRIVTLSN